MMRCMWGLFSKTEAAEYGEWSIVDKHVITHAGTALMWYS
jgi:hypothetical protein